MKSDSFMAPAQHLQKNLHKVLISDIAQEACGVLGRTLLWTQSIQITMLTVPLLVQNN